MPGVGSLQRSVRELGGFGDLVLERTTATVLCVMLASCVATGVRVTESDISTLQKGSTTYSEVIERFGKPNTTTIDSDGGRTVVYMYIEAQARPETYIPIIGGLVGGADSRMNLLTLRFDGRGILVDYSYSESESGTGTGFSSGTQFHRVDQQPRQ